MAHLGIEADVVAGTLGIVLDPKTDESVVMPWVETGPGEAIKGHVWLRSSGGLDIDFASRHYSAYCTSTRHLHGSTYNRVTPRYLWGNSDEWAWFIAAEEELTSLLTSITPESVDLIVEAINQHEGREAVRSIEFLLDDAGAVVDLSAKV